ncbi:MAG: hypothetical protein GY851_35395 [bacterium]|nr:hypothetical protein [bacterium]
MNDIDYEALGKAIAPHIQLPAPDCSVGLTREDATELKAVASGMRSARSIAWTTIIKAVVYSVIFLVGLGATVAWSRHVARETPPPVVAPAAP